MSSSNWVWTASAANGIIESMFESGGSGDVSVDTDVCVAGMLGVLARDVRIENVGRARIVETVCEIMEFRMADAEMRYRDPLDAHREVLCEIATALNVSLDVARKLVEVATRLHSMPLTAIRFVCGTLDWAHVMVLTSMLAKASERTIKAIEHKCVAAAARYNPRSLRKRIWQVWMLHDSEEAAEAQRASKKQEARVTIDPKENGMALLSAHMTDLQGAEAEQLISEIAGTVCKSDPRSSQELRVDGLVALLHGEHALECRCDTGEECPAAGVADGLAPRRAHLLQIMVGVETLLGLTSTPATLPDGTALDPRLVRAFAEDAQWQAILTEWVGALDVERRATAERSDGKPAEAGTTDAAVVDPADHVPADHVPVGDVSAGDVCAGEAPAREAPSGGVSGMDKPPTALMRVIGRTPARRGPRVPDVSSCAPVNWIPRNVLGDDVALDRYAATLLSMVEQSPSHPGVFPDGHGGLNSPPASALVYKPNAATVAMVRIAYRCCAFPGCDVPSTRCELDHIVPFDHKNPTRGGWTVASNLQPLCTFHHQAKTAQMWSAVMHAHGAIVWTSRTGVVRITMADFALPAAVHARRRKKPTKPIEPADATWWEKNMPDTEKPPTREEERAAESIDARNRIRRIRRRFREHKAVLRLREQLRPAPF